MKLTIIGAGTMGSALARELVLYDDVSEVVVCDSHIRSLQSLSAAIDSPKLRPFQVDARDGQALGPIIEGSQCLLGASAPALNLSLAELAIEAGSHFCDLGGSQTLSDHLPELGERAKEKGIWIVPNCGLDPGLANILCLLGVHEFDEPDRAWIRVGDVPLDPEPPFNFRISWSADKLINDYTGPALNVEDGQQVTADPLSEIESIGFGAPFEHMEAFATATDTGPIWDMAERVLRFLDHKTIRWPGHAEQMKFLIGLGFAEERIIDVRTHLTYRDILLRRLKQTLGGEHRDAVLLRVGISGRRSEAEETLIFELDQRFDAERGTSAVQKCTAVPAAIMAHRLARGMITGGGGAPPEQLVSERSFLEEVRERGLAIQERWESGADAQVPGSRHQP